MIILDRSGRDLVRRPPPLLHKSAAALIGLALVALVGASKPGAQPPAVVAAPLVPASHQQVNLPARTFGHLAQL